MVEQLASLNFLKAAGVGIFLAAIYYFLLAESDTVIRNQMATLRQQIATNKQTIGKQDEEIKKGESIELAKADMNQQLELAQSYLPEKFEDRDLLKILSDDAKAPGNNIISIQAIELPKGTETQAPPNYVEARFDIIGSFVEVTEFLVNLTKRDKFININSLILTRSGSGKSKDAKISARGTVRLYKKQASAPTEGATK